MAKPTKEQKAEDKQVEDWMTKKWRPMMAVMYMCVCSFDFIVAPVLWAVVQFWETQAANDAFRQWQPLTLQGAGLFHMAMGAVLGITAWSRGQEKLAGAAGGTGSSFGVGVGAPAGGITPVPPTPPMPTPPSFTPAPSFSAPTPSFGGKPAPVQPPHPEL
jgi:hypothetical protein